MSVLFWILYMPTGMILPVRNVTDSGNILVQVPGRENLRMLPESRRGSEWDHVEDAPADGDGR